MPNKNSAKKALRQAAKRQAENLRVKGAYKDAIKAVKKAVAANKAAEELTTLIQHAQKKLDKAAKRGVIKNNTASRKLSRLVKHVQKNTK